MTLAADVAAGLVQLALDPITFAVSKLITGPPKTRFHPIYLSLLACEPFRFASGQFSGSNAVADPLTLILLTFVDAAASLRRGVGNSECKTH